MDVLQVDAASITSSTEEQKRGSCGGVLTTRRTNKRSAGGGGEGNKTPKGKIERGGKTSTKKGTTLGGKGGTASNAPASDDLRNYAYEGEGSSPGSLSSCKSSRSRGGVKCVQLFL